MSGASPSTPGQIPETPPRKADAPLAVLLHAARNRARLVLLTERAAPLLMPGLAVFGLYVLAGLLRLPQGLPDPLHWLLLLASAALCLWLLRRGIKHLHMPSDAAVDQRIERASGLRNRPLTSLADQPAHLANSRIPDPWACENASLLWAAHQRRVLASLGRLRAGWPHLAPSSRDPRALGLLIPPALVVAVLLAGPAAPGRLAAAFIPGRDDPDTPFPHIEAWITPPSYAPGAPIFLSSGLSGKPPTVPAVQAGARLTVAITNLNGKPAWSGVTGEAMKPLGDGSWRAEALLDHSGTITLQGRGRVIARWHLTVMPDGMPSIVWGPSPGAPKGQWRTRLPYAAAHAYGIASVTAKLRLVHPGSDGKRVLEVPIPLAGTPKETKGVASPDLSADPWAGEAVTGVLVARSVSGHETTSPEAKFTLGARQFHSPVARAVLDLRKRLALKGETRNEAANDLAALGDTPGPIADNTGVFLNLTAIVSRLQNPDVADAAARDEAVGRLWDLALDIEDRLRGGAAGAQASVDVRAAQEAVAAQLKHMREDNAHGPQEQAELQRRMDVLKQAIARKMQALAGQAMRDHTAIPDLPGLTKSGNQAFSRLMQRLQDDAASGKSGNALEKMQQLEDSIEGMRNATPQDMAQLGEQMQAMAKAREQTQALNDLIKQQTALLDHAQSRLDRDTRAQERAQQQAQQQAHQQDGQDNDLATMPTAELLRRLGLAPQDSGPGSEEPSGGYTPPARKPDQSADATGQGSNAAPTPENHLASEARQGERATQHALGRALEELSQEFKDLTGKSPQGFSKAQDAMRDARKALAEGRDDDASKAEQKALEALQQGGHEMQQAMQGQGGGGTSFLPSVGSPQDGQGGSGDPEDGQDDAEEQGKGGPHDPLGRATGEGTDNADGQTHVPDTMSRERAHEIEKELRRRDSDRTRPAQELEYLDRLLKSF